MADAKPREERTMPACCHMVVCMPSCTVRSMRSAVSEDEPLEQRVAGKAVGPVEPCAGHLAAREQPRDGGLPPQARLHPPAEVVLRRGDRDGLGRDVDPLLQ